MSEIKPKTPAQRQAKYREKQKRLGLVDVTVTVPEAKTEEIKSIAKAMLTTSA